MMDEVAQSLVEISVLRNAKYVLPKAILLQQSFKNVVQPLLECMKNSFHALKLI